MIELTLQEMRDIEHTLENIHEELESAEEMPDTDFVSYSKSDLEEIWEMVRTYAIKEEEKYWHAVTAGAEDDRG